MFSEAPILIAEDNLYVALDLSIAIEEMDGRVVGPASSVAEALRLLATHRIAAAVIECHLEDRDSTPLARQLAERRVPFVIHTAAPVPGLIRETHPLAPILMKPLQPTVVLAHLFDEMTKAAGPTVHQSAKSPHLN